MLGRQQERNRAETTTDTVISLTQDGMAPKPGTGTTTSSSFRVYAKAAAVLVTSTAAYCVAKTTGWLPWSWWGAEADVTPKLDDAKAQASSATAAVPGREVTSTQTALTQDSILSSVLPVQSSSLAEGSVAIEGTTSALAHDMVHFTERELPALALPDTHNELMPREVNIGRKLLGIGDEFQVNTGTTGDQSFPTVAVLSDGGFVVTWSSAGSVYSQCYDATMAAVRNETKNVDPIGNPNPSFPFVTALANGGFAVAHNTYTSGTSGAGVNVFFANTTGTTIYDHYLSYFWSSKAKLAQLTNKAIVVTWGFNSDGSGNIVMERYNATAGTGTFGQYVEVSTYTQHVAKGAPAIAALTNGDFVIVWQEQNSKIYGNHYDANSVVLNNTFPVNTYSLSQQQPPAIAALAGGGFVVVWVRQSLFGQRFDGNCVALGGEFQINTYTAAYPSSYAVAALSNGGFVVVWDGLGQDENLTGIYAQRFDATGLPFGGEFRINTYTPDIQWFPSVAAFPDGGFVVVWASNGQDGSGYGIYGKVFGGITPTLQGSGGSLSYTENAAATVIDPALLVTDDADDIQSAIVAITSNFASGQDLLSFNAQGGINGFYNTSGGVLKLYGSDTVSVYQSVLRSVTYANSADNPSTATRTISFTANGVSLGGNIVTRDVNVIAVNDAPTLTFSGNLASTYTENGAATVIDSGLTVSDVDSPNLQSATVVITNFQTSDELLFSNQLGISGNYNATTGILTLTGNATSANYQTALRSVTYRTTSENPSTTARSVSMTVNDGFLDSASVSKTVNVIAVNDAPVITLTGGSSSYTENAAPVAINSGLTVNDVDSGNLQSAVVTITNLQAGDELVFTNQLGITGAYNAGTGVLTLSGTATPANYQTALRTVSYRSTSENPSTTPRSISLTVNDGSLSSNAVTRTMNVFAVNDAPVLTLSGNSSSYTENGAVVSVDSGLIVSDVDSTNLQSAAVTITNLKTGDELLFTNQLGITGAYNSGTGVLTLTGTTTVANYQAALRAVTYRNTLDNFDVTPRNISMTLNDGSLDSVAVIKTMNLIAVNDAPALAAGVTLIANNVDAGPPVGAVGTAVDAMITSLDTSYSDVDLGAVKGIAVTAADLTHGAWYYSITGGATWNSLGTPSVAASRLLRADGAGQSRIYFQPSPNYNGATSVTFRAWDQTSGNNGDTADTSVTGGITAFSANTQTASLTVSAAPVVVLSGASNSYTENEIPAFVDGGLTVNDVDNSNLQGAAVTITNWQMGDELLFTNQLGITGSYNPATGALTLTGTSSTANYQTALRAVVYRNTLDNPDVTPRQIRVTVNDGNLNSAPVIKTVNVIAVNDAPILVLGGASSSYIEKAAPVVLDGNLTVSDVDSANLQSATVTITNPKAGDELLFSNQLGISGSYNAGVLTLTGTASTANYQVALRTVTYRSTSNNPDTTARIISWIVNDGALNSTEVTGTLSVVAVNDAPVVVVGGGSGSYTENAAPVLVDAALTVNDADSANLQSAMVVISNFQVGDELLFTNQWGITGSYNAGTGVLTLTGDSTVDHYQTALRSVTYRNTLDNPDTTPRSVNFLVNDGSLNSTIVTKTVNIIAVDDAPVIALSGGSSSYTENAAPVVVDSGLVVSDVDNVNLQSALVRVTNLQAGDELLFTNQLGITGNYNATTGVLRLTGSSTLVNYQTLLRAVSYRNTLDNPNVISRSISFVVSDGSLDSAAVIRTVDVVAVNDAPVITSGLTLAAVEQDAGPPSGAVGTSVDIMVANLGASYGDPDGAGVPKGIAITAVDVSHGTWLYSTTGGTTWNSLGTPSALFSRLLGADGSGQNRIYFQPAAGYHGATSMTFRGWDQTSGSSGDTADTSVTGGTSAFSTNAQIASLTVAAAPVVILSGSNSSYIEKAAAVQIDSGLTVNDIDSSNLQSATVQLTNLQSGDELLFSNQLGITGAYNVGTGVLTLSGGATPTSYQTALRSVTYRSTSDNPNTTPRGISVVVNDGGLNSVAVTKTMNVVAVDDAPVLVNNTLTLSEGQAVILTPGMLSATDVDNNSAQLIFTISNVAQGRFELVGNPGIAITTFTQLQINNGQVQFVHDAGETAPSYQVSVSDGQLSTSAASAVIIFTNVNDSPVITSSTNTSAIFTENDDFVVIDGALVVSDVDNVSLQNATVAISENFVPGEDLLLFSNQNNVLGRYNESTGALVFTGTASVPNYQAVLRQVKYKDTSRNPSTALRAVRFMVNDGDANSGAMIRHVNVIAVNDVPTMTHAAGTVSYTGNVEVVQIDPTLIIADVDNNDLQGATVSLVGNFKADQDVLVFFAQNGILGSYNTVLGVLTLSGRASTANYQTALRSVAYQNSDSVPDRSKRSVEFKVYDGAGWSEATQRDITFTVLPIITTTDNSQSTLEEVKARALIAAPSVVGGLAVAAFGFWATRRYTARTWSPKEYRVANQLRQNLKLNLGAASSPLGLSFIAEVKAMIKYLSEHGHGDLIQLMEAQTEQAMAMLATIVTILKEHPNITWEKSRICYDLAPQPLFCWPKYDYRPGMISDNIAAISQGLLSAQLAQGSELRSVDSTTGMVELVSASASSQRLTAP